MSNSPLKAERGRPPKPVKLTETTIRLTDEHLAKLQLLCLDPLTSKLRYGARNDMIEQALNEFFAKHFPPRPGNVI